MSHFCQFWPNLGSAVYKTFSFKTFKVLFFLQNFSALDILFEMTYFWVFENQIGKAQGEKRSNFENIRNFNDFLCKVWGSSLARQEQHCVNSKWYSLEWLAQIPSGTMPDFFFKKRKRMIWGFIYTMSHQLPSSSSHLTHNIKLKK